MRETLNSFNHTFLEYGGQPSIYLLIIYHLDDPDYQAIVRVALNEYEAQEWEAGNAGKGLGRKVKRILVYTVGEP